MLLVAAMLIAQSAECRPPTTAERAALVKTASALRTAIVTPFTRNGWTINSDRSATTVEVSIATHPLPPRPLFDCSALFDLRLVAGADNPHAKALAQAMQTMQANPKAAMQSPAKFAEAYASAAIHVRASENLPAFPTPDGDHVQRLHVDGATVAFKEQSPTDPVTWSATLCFGRLPFHHGSQTPYVENFCVTTTTSAEVLKEMLRTVQWKSLNAGLTR